MIDYTEHAHPEMENLEEIFDHYDLQEHFDLDETYGVMVSNWYNARSREPIPEPSQAYMRESYKVLILAANEAFQDQDLFLNTEHTKDFLNLSEASLAKFEQIQSVQEQYYSEAEKLTLGLIVSNAYLNLEEDRKSELDGLIEDKIYFDNVSTGIYSSLTFNGVAFPNLSEFQQEITSIAQDFFTKEELEQAVQVVFEDEVTVENVLDKQLAEQPQQKPSI